MIPSFSGFAKVARPSGRAMALVLLCLAALACRDTTAPASFLGAWRLHSVEGETLPAIGTDPLYIHSGALYVAADGSFAQMLDIRQPFGGSLAGVFAGTYSRHGAGYRFHYGRSGWADGGYVETGSVHGDELVVEGVIGLDYSTGEPTLVYGTLVYRREP